MDVSSCLELERGSSELVIKNNCGYEVFVKKLELRYYVTGLPSMPKREEYKRFRRLIREFIDVSRKIAPYNTISIYFGPVENIEEVYAIIFHGGKEVRVRLA